MDKIFFMHTLQSVSDLLDDGCCFFFRKLLFFLDVLKTAIRQRFKNQIQILLVMKVSKERRKMRIVEVRLYFDFSKNVFLNFGFFDSFLGHFFNDTNKAYSFLLSDIDIAKCSFT